MKNKKERVWVAEDGVSDQLERIIFGYICFAIDFAEEHSENNFEEWVDSSHE